MLVSIATAYLNRKPQFLATLNSIQQTCKKLKNDDLEIVVVDDASEEDHRLSNKDFEDAGFTFKRKIIRVDEEKKFWCNPCLSFNLAFLNCSGENIIIQNPECFHLYDVVDYTINNLKKNDYFSYACFSADPKNSELIQKFSKPENPNYKKDIVNNIEFSNLSSSSHGQFNTWYNHSQIRPMAYHFCSAIKKDDLLDLGGFDNNFSMGVGYDDDEFLFRIHKKGMNIKIVDYPSVIHQYHRAFCGNGKIAPTTHNYSVFHGYTKQLEDYRVDSIRKSQEIFDISCFLA